MILSGLPSDKLVQLMEDFGAEEVVHGPIETSRCSCTPPNNETVLLGGPSSDLVTSAVQTTGARRAAIGRSAVVTRASIQQLEHSKNELSTIAMVAHACGYQLEVTSKLQVENQPRLTAALSGVNS